MSNVTFYAPIVRIDFELEDGRPGYIEEHCNPKCYDVYLEGNQVSTQYSLEDAKNFVKNNI